MKIPAFVWLVICFILLMVSYLAMFIVAKHYGVENDLRDMLAALKGALGIGFCIMVFIFFIWAL